PGPVVAVPDIAAVVADKVQEIQFYIAQGFWEIAQGAIEDLRQIAPHATQLQELEAAVVAGQAPPPEPAPAPPEPAVAAPSIVAIPEPVSPAPIEAAPPTVETVVAPAAIPISVPQPAP